MTKLNAYRFLSNHGREASFLGNVLFTRGYPAKVIATAAELVKAGHDVRFAQFSTDTILVDGYSVGGPSQLLNRDAVAAAIDGREMA